MKETIQIWLRALLQMGAIAAWILLMTMSVCAAGWRESASPPKQSGLSGWWYALNDELTCWYAAETDGQVAWHWIDGNGDGTAECYAFNREGWMYAGTLTPDGYQVNADGAWTVDGVVKTRRQLRSISTGRAGTGHGSGGRGSASSAGAPGVSSADKAENTAHQTENAGSETTDTNVDADIGADIEADTQRQLHYTLKLIDVADESVLDSILGTGRLGEDIVLAGQQIAGYTLAAGQPLSARLESDNALFIVRYLKNQPEQTARASYAYTVNYTDIDTRQVLMTETGRAEAGTLVPIAHPSIEGYELMSGQRSEFKLLSDNTVQQLYYKQVERATPPEAQMIDWTLHFVDAGNHSRKLWPSRSGRLADGGRLTINFPQTIHDDEGTVWTSAGAPPLERQIFGPGRYIEYIEFTNSGRAPAQEDLQQTQKEQLREYLRQARVREAALSGEDADAIPDSRFIVTDQRSNDVRVGSMAARVNAGEAQDFYIIGKNFVPNGKVIASDFDAGTVYANLLLAMIRIADDSYYVARIGIQRAEMAAGSAAPQEVHRRHWRIGDVLTRNIDGVPCRFRCIDQNYSDGAANHRQGALFLADSIIPANYASKYELRAQADGSHAYAYVPGPLVSFGSSNEYKYSKIRSWLAAAQADFQDAEPISTGVAYAWMGTTAEREFEDFDATSLRAYRIGHQQLTDKLFILSVDEALKYKEALWRLEGAETDNPASQAAAFARGYWLRSPMGNDESYDTDYVYVVDITGGNIHPAGIRPEADSGDEELDTTAVYGVRPAFVLAQD